MDRRVFLGQGGVCLTAAISARLGLAQSGANTRGANQPGSRGLPENWKTARKIDAHAHVTAQPESADLLIEAADALGINQLCCSLPTSAFAPPAEVRQANDAVLAAMRRYPERILGYCFLIPGYQETLPELERCLDAGMIGVKLYNQVKYSDAFCFPIIEHCIQRQVPILGHAGHVCDASTKKRQPNISDAAIFCAVARRYPEAILIHAHVHGGGDWEWTIKRLRNCANVYLDTGGSVLDDRTIEMATALLGHERVLFATDNCMENGVGRIYSAELTDAERDAILWRNMQALLQRRKS
jgi:uncharacterized protein